MKKKISEYFMAYEATKVFAIRKMKTQFTNKNTHISTIKIENRSQKISKKPKIGVCTLFSNLDNILKVLMYPLGAFSIMTSFLFDFPIELKKVKFQIHL
jgi:hypothetical protein